MVWRHTPVELKREVEAAVIEEAERVGPTGIDRKAVVDPFLDRGVSQATLYRWVAACLNTGDPTRRALAKIREARAAKPAREPIPVEDIEAALPHAEAALEAVTGAPKGNATIAIIDKLEECLRAAEQVMAYARTKEGDVRNAKLLLTATEAQRRGLETALRISTELRELQATDQFHAAVIAEFKKLAPDVGARLALRLQELTTIWQTERS